MSFASLRPLRRPFTVCVALLGAWLAVLAGAQEPTQPIFRTGVRVVRVDVSVTGKGNQPVSDLSAGDFTLEEDGVRQTVDTAQFIKLDGHRQGDSDSLSIRSQEHAEAEAQRDDVRLFALFLDDYHVDKKPQITQPLRKALLSFLDRLGPADLAVWMDPLTPLSALRFTRDYEDIKAVVRKFEGRQGELFPIKSAMEEEQLTSRNPSMIRAEVTLSALGALVTRLGNMREGRKSVIFVSQGPRTMWAFEGLDVEHRMEDVLQAANRGNVTINVFDPRGLGGEGVGSRDTLMRLAAETGGREIINTNGFEQALERVVADASAYYLLGYTPTRTEDDGKFHKISVKVKRSGVDVLARKGYWAPDPKEVTAAAVVAAKPETPGLTEALTPMSQSKTGRVADVWVGYALQPGGAPRLLVTWEPSKSPEDGAGQRVTSLDVERLGPDGKPVGPAVTVASASGAQARGSLGTLDVPAGEVVLRFTAKANGEDPVDRWNQKFEVPDPQRVPLGLAPPVIKRARSPLEFRTIRQDAGVAPTAARVFRRTDRVLVELPLFGTEAGRAALTVDLLNKGGQVLLTIPAPPIEQGRVQFELPVGGLVQSTYVLRITAVAGEHKAERLEAFETVP